MRYQVIFFDENLHHEFIREFHSLSAAKSYCICSSKARILYGSSHFSIYCYKDTGVFSHSYFCDKYDFTFTRYR